MKKILFLVVCCATFVSQAQIQYQKFYDSQKKHAAVEGMMTDDSVRMGQWTWWHQNGRVYQQGTYDRRGQKTGTWHIFYDNGAKCADECYDNGTSRL